MVNRFRYIFLAPLRNQYLRDEVATTNNMNFKNVLEKFCECKQKKNVIKLICMVCQKG